MATEKLYYQDQYLRNFTANILKLDMDDQGQNFVVLDKTAFYPTGGGQPYDTGTLNDVEVYDVEEIDGEIRHYITEPIENQKECIGKINWDRRLDHMQQHAGQHILTAAFEDNFGYKTVSFHLGKELCSIDLETNELNEIEATQAENIANRIILENHSIETKWVSQDEISHFKLRKKLSVTENIRLVIIPDYDYNGCGGTHPNSTGQVSSIKVLHWEKQKKNVRVFFVCGGRVRQQLHEKHQVIQGLTSLLSAPQDQLEEAANRILLQTKELEKTINDLKIELMEYEANSLISSAEEIYNGKIVKEIFQHRPISELQQLAKSITEKSDEVIVFFINETDEKIQLVCACGKNVRLSMNNLIKQILPTINGKGGGSDRIAQGGGDKLVSADKIMENLLEAGTKLVSQKG